MDGHIILIVDDDSNVRELLRVNCVAQGLNVLTAGDGAEALRLVEQHIPELVILDVMMPEMDGWEVCKQIRDKYQDSIKVVMLTAKDTARDKIIGKNILKADEYLTKPFDIDELLATVHRLLLRESA
jgi:DNA-binding response OmpR family regulator